MYIRAKFINGKYYYYLVESKRINGKTVQRSLAYLGEKEEAIAYAEKHKLKVVEPKPRKLEKGMTKLDYLIELKKKRLDSLKISEEVEKKYREDLEVAWTYHSTTIEGSTLSLEETDLFLSKGIVGPNKPFEDYLDAKGHKDAIELIFLWLTKNKKRPIQKIDILNLHKVTMWGRDWGGNYRETQVYIRGSKHVPPPPSQVKSLMKEFTAKLNMDQGKIPTISHSANSHIDFESIHPFVDGNGRVGRLLVNWLLLREGYPPIIIEVKDRKRYFNLLGEAQIKNDPTRLIWFFKNKLNQAYDFYLSRVDPKYETWLKSIKSKKMLKKK